MVDLLKNPVIEIDGKEHEVQLKFATIRMIKQGFGTDEMQRVLEQLINGSITASAMIVEAFLKSNGIKSYTYEDIGDAMIGKKLKATIIEEGEQKDAAGVGSGLLLYNLVVQSITESTKTDEGTTEKKP